jgi:hypothetical protein
MTPPAFGHLPTSWGRKTQALVPVAYSSFSASDSKLVAEEYQRRGHGAAVKLRCGSFTAL